MSCAGEMQRYIPPRLDQTQPQDGAEAAAEPKSRRFCGQEWDQAWAGSGEKAALVQGDPTAPARAERSERQQLSALGSHPQDEIGLLSCPSHG